MNLSDIAAELASLLDEQARLRDEIARTKADIVATLREQYPDEWNAWQRGVRGIKVGMVNIPVSREYDIHKVRSELGETHDVIREEWEERVIHPAKVDKRKVAGLWKDADMARKLAKCLLPPVPDVKLRKE